MDFDGSLFKAEEAAASAHRADYPSEQEQRAVLIKTSHIHLNPDTGLSTDFLNQYNELVMMLDLAASDPEILQELSGWYPKSYCEHFENSRLRDWNKAVDAYHIAPRVVRSRLNALSGELNMLALAGLGSLQSALRSGPTTGIGYAAQALSEEMRSYIERLMVIIDGDKYSNQQADIDALFD